MTTKDKVIIIERFPLWISHKTDLLLVISGQKLATSIIVYGRTVGCDTEQVPEPSRARISALENLCKRVGLAYRTIPLILHRFEDDNKQYFDAIVCIGRNEEYAKNMESVWRNITVHGLPAKSQDAEHGRLSGFPSTAIKAFCKNRDNLLLSNASVQKRINDLVYRNFCQFRFSREHFYEELKTPQEWAKQVKKLSPTLYSQLTK